MAYRHISFEERQRIEKMYKSGESIAFIAEEISRPLITVKRELGRCPEGAYNAETAQTDAESKHKVHVENRTKTQNENNQKKSMRLIKACLIVNPEATAGQIARAANLPIERVEKYYDAIKFSL